MSGAGSQSLEAILEALEETLDSFGDVLAELAPDDWHKPTGCPGWDVHDVVSHIVGFELSLAAMAQPASEAEQASRSAAPNLRTETDRAITADVENRRGRSPQELLDEYRVVTARSTAVRRASGRSAEEILEGPFGWKLPYDQLLSLRIFDCLAHEQDVRRAVGRPGDLDGRAAVLVERLVFDLLPGVLPSRVSALKDHRVRIEITDRAGHLVAGRRSDSKDESDASDGETDTDVGGTRDGGKARADADATVRMPFSELVALACGRADVFYDLVEIEGDASLARDVIEHMAFTP